MKLYLKGVVVSIGKSYVIFETNSIGTIIHMAQPNELKCDKKIKLFVYEYESEYQKSVYGFKTFNERLLFEDLISVSGVGPKTALSSLKNGYQIVATHIANGDIASLSNFRYMGEKSANQICIELSKKYQNKLGLKNGQILPSEISTSLKTLGFKNEQINYAINKLNPSDNVETLIENAIKIISNAN